jgi:hypothetical protein
MGESIIINTFNKMWRDSRPEVQPEGTYFEARNATKKTDGFREFGLVNEKGTEECVTLPSGVIGGCYVVERDWDILILEGGEFGIFDHAKCTYKKIFSANEIRSDEERICGRGQRSGGNLGCDFGFSNCEWVHLEYRFWNACSELHVEWSSGCTYYNANIDALLDPARKSGFSCEDFKTFKCTCIPTIFAKNIEGGGSGLTNGAYQFVARLKDKDGHKTNFFNISNAVVLGSKTNIPGEVSTESIQVYIEGLDCNYNTIELAVIDRSGGKAEAFIIETLHYNGQAVTYTYHGPNGREIPIPLDEILVKKKTYLRGRAVTQHDGTAVYYQIKNENNLDYQRRANNIKIKLLNFKVKAKVAHHYAGLQGGENYIPAIVWQMCDGTETAGFPLTNYGARVTELSTSNGDPELSARSNGTTDQEYDPPTTANDVAGPPFDSYANYGDLNGNHNEFANDNYPLTKGEFDSLNDKIDQTLSDKADIEPDASCVECGADSVQDVVDTDDELIGDEIFGGFDDANMDSQTDWPGDGVNPDSGRTRIKKQKYKSQRANNIKDALKGLIELTKDEEVFVPTRQKYEGITGKPNSPKNEDLTLEDTYADQRYGTDAVVVKRIDAPYQEDGCVYPYTKNCEGDYIYGDLAGKPIRLLRIPEDPHFYSPVTGVKSEYRLGVDETEGHVYMWGLEVSDIVFPTEDELPKPLCPNQPWKIVYVPRNQANSRVIASGIFVHTFNGSSNGREFAIPRHGVNSNVFVDRSIQGGGDDFNHIGSESDSPIYCFFSPDTLLGKVPLFANKALITGVVSGVGYKHGHYAEGDRSTVGFFGRAKDQRGTRQSMNLSDFTIAKSVKTIRGISYAKGNINIENPRGIDKPLLNVWRESSVFLQLDSLLPGASDDSFLGDGLCHNCDVPSGSAPYGHLIREFECQYGGVENMTYVDLGIYGKEGATSGFGLVGDSHVGSFSFRRTSYVSNKVGNRPLMPSPRKWNAIARFFGAGDSTAPPENGDIRDPKNMANMRPGLCCPGGGQAVGDLYYPRVLKTLVYSFYQSRVNSYYRQIGKVEGEIHADNLNGFALDSNIPHGGAWEKSFLNRFYSEVIRESKFDGIIRIFLRFVVIIAPLVWYISFIFNINSIPDIFTFVIRTVLFALLYVLLLRIFRVSSINKVLGLKNALSDLEGGATDESIKQWEDNYMEYSSNYSVVNDIGHSFGMSDPYNTCNCNDCLECKKQRPGGVPSYEWNNEIFVSAKQRPETEINAYRHVLEGNYTVMPADAGSLQKILVLNNGLLAHTTDGIYHLQSDNSGGTGSLLGQPKLIDNPQRMFEGVIEGYAGTKDPNAGIVTPHGYVFIDRFGRNVCLYNGSSVEFLSGVQYGLNRFWHEFGDYCPTKECCIDQKMNGSWYSLGYDHNKDLLLVTKNDGAGSFTLSFDFDDKSWASFHDYIPQLYLNDRFNFYSVYENKIHKHGVGAYQTYYGRYYPFYVHFISSNLEFNNGQANERTIVPFLAEHQKIHTEANVGGLMNRHYTFNKGAWWNSYQTCGEYILEHPNQPCDRSSDMIKDKGMIAAIDRKSAGAWNFNKFRDNIVDEGGVIVERATECLPFLELVNYECSKKDGNIKDYYLHNKLTLDDGSNVELRLLRVVTHGKKQEI